MWQHLETAIICRLLEFSNVDEDIANFDLFPGDTNALLQQGKIHGRWVA